MTGYQGLNNCFIFGSAAQMNKVYYYQILLHITCTNDVREQSLASGLPSLGAQLPSAFSAISSLFLADNCSMVPCMAFTRRLSDSTSPVSIAFSWTTSLQPSSPFSDITRLPYYTKKNNRNYFVIRFILTSALELSRRFLMS